MPGVQKNTLAPPNRHAIARTCMRASAAGCCSISRLLVVMRPMVFSASKTRTGHHAPAQTSFDYEDRLKKLNILTTS